jgi:hypothetical protein
MADKHIAGDGVESVPREPNTLSTASQPLELGVDIARRAEALITELLSTPRPHNRIRRKEPPCHVSS